MEIIFVVLRLQALLLHQVVYSPTWYLVMTDSFIGLANGIEAYV